jgi:predicted MPP superfamily phosphohydrolase
VGLAVTGGRLPRNASGGRQLGALALLFVWLEAGYAAALMQSVPLPWRAALWQAAVCVLANPPLLLLVIKVLSSAKAIQRLPRAISVVFWVLLDLSQVVLPWLGWSALIALMNAGRVSYLGAVWAATPVALFSYLTAFAIVLAFRPKPSDVQIAYHDVPVPGLPRTFDGYRILHLSDLHAGGLVSLHATAERLRPAASLDPDLIAVTGDFASGMAGRIDAAAALLGGMSAKDGVVAVLGNHDHWMGEERVIDALSKAGLKLLLNGSLAIPRDGEALYLVGVKDASYTKRDDLSAALRGVPDGVPVILLSHSPEIMDQPLSARASLILSGHTHGGQVVLPYVGPIHVPSEVPRRLASGLHQLDGRWLFVNRGLGEIFPPVRINCPPEMALLTLRSAPASR